MYAHNSPSVSLQMAQVRSSENSCSTTLVNKGNNRDEVASDSSPIHPDTLKGRSPKFVRTSVPRKI
jgi:hypothetical protein